MTNEYTHTHTHTHTLTDQGALFSENRKYNHFSLMLDVTVTNPLGPSALARAGFRAGYAIEEAVKAKNTKYGGTYRPTHKLVPLAFSTCGDYSSSAQDLVKEQSKLKAEMAADYLEASETAKLGIRARETGRLRRRLSVVLQKALAYRTGRYIRRQQIAERWRPKPGPPVGIEEIDTPGPKRTRQE